MNILLINPPSTLEKKVLDVTSDIPPLGLMDVGTQVLYDGHEVEILDASVNRYSIEKTVSKALEVDPEVIGITAHSSDYHIVKKISSEIKKAMEIPIILGGVHATVCTRQCIESGIFDYIVAGEADECFPLLIDAILEDKSRNIAGVNHISNNKIVLNPHERPKELTKFHMRSWDLVDISKYRPSRASYTLLPAVSTMISRGCPNHKCTFCASRRVFGKKYRSYSMSQIRQELEYFKGKGIRDINFVDINFTTNRRHTIAISRLLAEYGFKWNITTRCDYVDLDLLKIMNENGCYQIGYGIEVGTQEELDLIKKNYTIHQIKKAVNDTVKAGISVKCYFTMGYPWQKREDIQKTIDFAKELNPDIAVFSIINPYPGTELFEKYSEKQNFNIELMNHRSALNTISEYLNENQLIEIMEDAYKQYYYRPLFLYKSFFRYIKNIKSTGDCFNVLKGLRYITNK